MKTHSTGKNNRENERLKKEEIHISNLLPLAMTISAWSKVSSSSSHALATIKQYSVTIALRSLSSSSGEPKFTAN
jgi:hypothetical protein